MKQETLFKEAFVQLFTEHAQDHTDIACILSFLTDFVVTGMIEVLGPEDGIKAISERVNTAASALQEIL